MRKYNSLFFSVMIFLLACNSNKTPGGIINKQDMTALLTEVHIVDGNLYSTQQVPDSLYKYGYEKYLAVFRKFHTDSIQFKKSFQYYSLHPDVLESIYNQITINIKGKSDSLTKLNQQKMAADNKRMADSLRKLPKVPVSDSLRGAPNRKQPRIKDNLVK